MDGVEYRAELIGDADGHWDIRLHQSGRVRHLGGKRGRENELERVAHIASSGVLPVFLGSGLGDGLDALLSQNSGPVAVVDAESAILELTAIREKWENDERIFWITNTDAQAALNALTRWQMLHGGLPFASIINPFYSRLRPELYRNLGERLAISRKVDFWTQARYPKFYDRQPRILLLTSTYFLIGELEAACKRLGHAVCLLQLPGKEVGVQKFVEDILAQVIAFRPDFVLTINHLGVDREGVLINLLERLELPLASWFVDNPHLILYIYENLSSPWVTLFTWDADNIDSLKAQGFSRVHYLPLGTDNLRFRPPAHRQLVRDVAFVGNSMVHKVRDRLLGHSFPRILTRDYEILGQAFVTSERLSVTEFLEQEFPEYFAAFIRLPDIETRLGFEALLTWQATLIYRLERVKKLLPFKPLLVGDSGWYDLLPPKGWSYQKALTYYTELPAFYPATRVNFNCTSQQMKGAVNQRVFDIPVCGGFVLTDYRRQMEYLFDLGREMICYQEPEEIPDLIRYYRDHDKDRQQVIKAGRRRILAEHTYDRRLTALVQIMRQTYA